MGWQQQRWRLMRCLLQLVAAVHLHPGWRRQQQCWGVMSLLFMLAGGQRSTHYTRQHQWQEQVRALQGVRRKASQGVWQRPQDFMLLVWPTRGK